MALDKNVSPDADTTLFFTRGSVGAVDGSIELPAGKIVEFLVGFANKVNIIFLLIRDMVVERWNRRFGRETIYPTQKFT